MQLLKQIERLFFDNPILEFKSGVEGQKCEGGKYLLGDKAGPEKATHNLLHEICHFAEREVKKLKEFPPSNWGFTFGKYWQIGTSWGYEPQTIQSLERESRVWAYQLALSRELEFEDSPRELVSSATWLSSWCYFSSSFKFNEELALKELAKTVDRMSKSEYTYQRLMEEFHHRVENLV